MRLTRQLETERRAFEEREQQREAELHKLESELERRADELLKRDAELQQREADLENERKIGRILRARIDILIHRLFGRKTEQLDPGQLALFQEAVSQLPDEKKPEGDSGETLGTDRKRRRKPVRKPLPEELVRRRVEIDVEESQKTCAACGTAKKRIGEDVSERLLPPQPPEVLQEVRPKYACPRCHDGVSQAPSAPHLIEKGIATDSLLAYVATMKYGHHLPLYRQEDIFARWKVSLSRSTLCDWMMAMGEALEPVYESEKRRVLASDYIKTDDTPIVILNGRSPPLHKGRLWVYHAPLGARPGVVYEATKTHEAKWPLAFLKDFKGKLQADAYKGYDAVYRTLPVVEIACWAHARRRIREAVDSQPEGGPLLAQIAELYRVERRADEDGVDAEQRTARRMQTARPILTSIFSRVEELSRTVLPQSPLGKGLTYITNQRVALQRYIEDGRIGIDNNAAERLLRGVALGRKNWLFAGSMQGAKAAAVLFSLIASCGLVGIDPQLYLADILPRLREHPSRLVDELTPSGWALARRSVAA